MHLVRAAREGVDHRVRDALEKRLEQAARRAAFELVLQGELDARRPRRERAEPPGGGKAAERALDQLQVDGLAGGVAVERRERLPQSAHAGGQGGPRGRAVARMD